MRLLILPDPANVFAPSDNAILLPLSLPEAPIGILPTTSPPARSTAEVDMSAFDENMDPSSSSLSSSLKRDRDSPAEVKPVGTKVRILPLRIVWCLMGYYELKFSSCLLYTSDAADE